MKKTTFDEIREMLLDCFELQEKSVAIWHFGDPDIDDDDPAPENLAALRVLVHRQHYTNFRLWHVEDEARRRDVGPEVIAKCKQDIDSLNQQRNDYIEKMDTCLLNVILPLLPEECQDRFNTETIGCALDRLSILNLKIYHMYEQTRRKDVDEKHRGECQCKLEVLKEQSRDLGRSVLHLVEEYSQGLKRPKVYYQFKMYNDPNLNPSLYQAKGGPGGEQGG